MNDVNGPGLAAQDDQILIGYQAVCVIDVLGQKERLAGWTKPYLDGNREQFAAALKKTVGTVAAFRDAFKDFFSQFDRTRLPPEKMQLLDAEQRDLYERFRECKLSTQQFSDTFVFYSPLVNSRGDLSPEPFYRSLTACAMIMLFSLAGGVPVRGGFCVDLGIELAASNFYGPGLSQAHQLESEIAQYPRIVVSKDVVNFISRPPRLSENNKLNEVMTTALKSCEGLICKDEYDGTFMVDFLGQGMRQINAGNHEKDLGFIRPAYLFVRDQVKNFTRTKNVKLLERYQRLERYMNSRSPLWGVDPAT